MPDLVLHHFDISPFAEKIRTVFGLKDLAWHSVRIPIIMPKPDLMPLTGGYRKTPVLQIGADIYCDTSLIARELERRFPEPSLYPQGGRGLAHALSRWSDKSFFEPGAALSMAENEEIPESILEDRKAFFNFMDFDRLDEARPHCYAQLRANAQLLEDELEDGRAFLTGQRPGLADVNAWFVVWMCRNNIPGAGRVLDTLPAVGGWEARMADIGQGRRTETTAEVALEVARSAEPAPGSGVAEGEFLDLREGQTVTVAPDDYGCVEVAGTVVTANPREIAIRRHDDRVGDVVVHFPRIGYRVEAR